MRDDVLAELVDEERRRWQVAVQVEEVRRLHLLLILVGGQQKFLLDVVAIHRRDPPRVNFHLAQKGFVDDARVGTLVAAHLSVELVEEPSEEVDRIALLDDLEPLAAPQHDGLKHLVRRNVSLKVPRVPQLPHKLAESLHQRERRIASRSLYLRVVRLHQEEIPDGLDVRQCLQDHVAVVIGFDVVQADNSWVVERSLERPRRFGHFRVVQDFDVHLSERRVQHVLDVLKVQNKNY